MLSSLESIVEDDRSGTISRVLLEKKKRTGRSSRTGQRSSSVTLSVTGVGSVMMSTRITIIPYYRDVLSR